MNILIIRSAAIGDVIMSTSFLKNVRELYPKATISFLVGNYSKSVLRDNPHVDEVISFDDEIVNKKKLVAVLKLAASLRKKKFDLCFILDKSWMWNAFAFLCKIKKRVGFSRDSSSFTTKSVKFLGKKHESEYNLDLLRAIGKKPAQYKPQLFSKVAEIKSAKNKVKDLKSVAIAPGGASNPGQSATIKRWPLQRYIELCDKIKNPVIIIGSKQDKSIAQNIMKETKNTHILDCTGVSMQESKEIIERCKLCITHDSGALHIASAANTKIIALFGPTPALRFAPKGCMVISAKTPPTYTPSGSFGSEVSNHMGEISVKQVLSKVNFNKS